MISSVFSRVQRVFSRVLRALPLLVLLPLTGQALTSEDVSKMSPQERAQAALMLDIQSNFYHSVQDDLQKGAQLNALLPDGQLPILEAIAHHADRTFELLWKNPKLNINAVNHLGENLMMYLAIEKTSQLDKIQSLIDRGARVNKWGWTPLVYAIYGNHPEIVALLLKHGAMPDQLDPNGRTPLTLVVNKDLNLSNHDRLQLLKTLIAGGANPMVRDSAGKQAVDYAEPGSELQQLLNQAMKTYLVQHGYLDSHGEQKNLR